MEIYAEVNITTITQKVDNLAWYKIYKRSIFESYVITFNKRIGEDTLFVYKYLSHSSKVAVTWAVCYYYRINPYSLSSLLSTVKLAAMIVNHDEILDFILSCKVSRNHVENMAIALWKGIVKRTDSMNHSQRKDVFSSYNPQNSYFSEYISPFVSYVVPTFPVYLAYKTKLLGIKSCSKGISKAIDYDKR